MSNTLAPTRSLELVQQTPELGACETRFTKEREGTVEEFKGKMALQHGVGPLP